MSINDNKWVCMLIMGVILFFTNCSENEDKVPDIVQPLPEIIFNPDLSYGTVTDIEGNIYKTITIGTQTWMAENLRTRKYRNGNQITKVSNTEYWSGINTGAYSECYNNINYSKTYGLLYNWYAVNDIRNLTPIGWHVPTDDEWNTLINYLGGNKIAGGKLKETGTTHWASPNTGATNESGFSALSGGYLSYDGEFTNILLHNASQWWSSSEINPNIVIYHMNYCYAVVERFEWEKSNGLYIRCIKD
jgi:uncharacterized protein (TIGR02145 family)